MPITGQRRRRPTCTAMPPPVSASSLGWGRSSASCSRIAGLGALGRPRRWGSGIQSRSASRTRSGGGSPFRRTLTASVWPSITGTRWQRADTAKTAGSTRSPARRPSSLGASASTLGSSPGMKGTTLPSRSRLGTPGQPAPLAAWRLAMRTASTPKAACSGASTRASIVVVQLGFVRMPPVQPRVARWAGSRPR